MHFESFPYPDPFLECQCFVNLFAVHFIRARSSLIPSFSGFPLRCLLDDGSLWSILRKRPSEKHPKNQKFSVYRRHIIWRYGRAELRKFLIFLNSQHPNIHFTIDIEENGKFLFLDVFVSKKADDTLSQVYRKPTHTDRYLHAELRHHSA